MSSFFKPADPRPGTAPNWLRGNNREERAASAPLPMGAALVWPSVDQVVEFGGVLAGDLVHDLGREAGELLLDVFCGFGPNAVGVRVVRTPHHRLDADVVDKLARRDGERQRQDRLNRGPMGPRRRRQLRRQKAICGRSRTDVPEP